MYSCACSLDTSCFQILSIKNTCRDCPGGGTDLMAIQCRIHNEHGSYSNPSFSTSCLVKVDDVIAARIRRMGKVMFSHGVCLSGEGEYPSPRSFPRSLVPSGVRRVRMKYPRKRSPRPGHDGGYPRMGYPRQVRMGGTPRWGTYPVRSG